MTQDQTAFSRVCPSCGRRVPRNVAACRCGAELPAESITAPEAIAEATSSSNPAVVVAMIVAAVLLVGGGYWMFLRPVPGAAQIEAAVEEEEEQDAAATSAAEPAGPSAAARAWDAAANATYAAPPEAAAAAPVAPAAPSTAVAGTTEEMVDRVMPAVVLIKTTGGRGSGFFIRHDTLITNVHVVENDTYVTLQKSDGSTVSARVETKAPAFDLAILKVATPSPNQAVIPLGSARALKPGQEIVLIGSALGTLQNSVSRGIVSGLRRAGGATLVQTDAAANPGNSGGPMLDRNGAAIGVTTLKYKESEGLNFGVAIDHARDLLEGRQANLGSSLGLNEIQAQNRDSETDRQQQQGEEQFRSRMGQLARAAGDLDDGWKRYRAQCYTSPIPGSYDREWFAMLRSMPANAAAGCTEYFQEMDRAAKEFRSLMQRALGEARRANVLPGTIRDELRKNRLDFDWDR